MDRKRLVADYVFGARIGEGLYLTVYLAVDSQTKKTYAIKVLSKRHIVREDKIKYVNIEKTTLHRLGQQHPGIVQLFYTFQDALLLFFVLDFAEYGELLLVIRKLGLLSEPLSKFYMCQILDAVKFIHLKGVIHRDLKPENILVGSDFNLKITDFGAAKLGPSGLEDEEEGVDYAGVTEDSVKANDKPLDSRTGLFVGTAEYVAPELLKNNACGPEGDVWAMGCILYQLFSGTPPFKGETEYLTFEKIINISYSYKVPLPPDVVTIIDHILVEDIHQRWTIAQIEAAGWFSEVTWDANYIWGRKVPRFEPYVAPSNLNYVPMIKTGRNFNKLSLYHALHSQIKLSDIYVPLVGKNKTPSWQRGGNYLKIGQNQHGPPGTNGPPPPPPPANQANYSQMAALAAGGQRPPQQSPQTPLQFPAMAAAALVRPYGQYPPPQQQRFALGSSQSPTQGPSANLTPQLGQPPALFTPPVPRSPEDQRLVPNASPQQRPARYGQQLPGRGYPPQGQYQYGWSQAPSRKVIPPASGANLGAVTGQSLPRPQAPPTPKESPAPPPKAPVPAEKPAQKPAKPAKPATSIKYSEVLLLLDQGEEILKLDNVYKLHLLHKTLGRDASAELDDVTIEQLVNRHASALQQQQTLVVAVITTKARVFFIDHELNVMLVDLKANAGADYLMYDYDFEPLGEPGELGNGYLILELIKEGGDLVFLKRVSLQLKMSNLNLGYGPGVQVVQGSGPVTVGDKYSWIECLLMAKTLVSEPPAPQSRSGTHTPPQRAPKASLSSPSSHSLGKQKKKPQKKKTSKPIASAPLQPKPIASGLAASMAAYAAAAAAHK